MAEVAETVDDALDALAEGATTDEVLLGTIAFSAREIAAAAASRAGDGGGGGAEAPASIGEHRLRMGDTLTPVVAEGLGHSVAASHDDAEPRTFFVNGDPGSVVSMLGKDLLGNYLPGPHQRVGIALHVPNDSYYWSPTTEADVGEEDDHIYGLPGASIWETRLLLNAKPWRLSQRWYSVPGVTDCLYFEVSFAPDATAALSQSVYTYVTNLCVVMQTKAERIEECNYDATLDGIGMNGRGSGVGYPTYTFLRSLTHQSTEHKYDETIDLNYDFWGGTISGADVDDWFTATNQVYNALIAYQSPARIDDSRQVFRFVLGCGYSPDEARLATRDAPNISMAEAVRKHTDKLLRYPALQNATYLEQKAWAFHLHTMQACIRTPADQFQGKDWMANAGEYAELPNNGPGRWNGLWTGDTPQGLLGTTHVNPGMVLDSLNYMFHHRMVQTTFGTDDDELAGFLYYNRAAPGDTHVQIGAFLFARILRRYLAHTSDLENATALYPKMKLMWEWWTTLSSDAYRHPDWPDVMLFTTKIEHETQEQGIVTSAGSAANSADPEIGGNYPAGDDWIGAWAYDFCIHMASLATSTGNGADVGTWMTWASNLKAAIQTYTWDAGLGWFQPVMTPTSVSGGQPDSLGRFQAALTYRGFMHMWAGTATVEQGAIMRDKFMDPDVFLSDYGIRTANLAWSGFTPGHWVKGASRPYYDNYVSMGLRRYGYDDDADTILDLWKINQLRWGTTPEMIDTNLGTTGYSAFLFSGNALMEAYLAKCDPDRLCGIGLEEVTS